MRLIDADALIEDVDGDLSDSIAEGRAIEKIESAPTVDAVLVVRCKDCKWFRTSHDWVGAWYWCVAQGGCSDPEPDGYCSKAERKGDKE